MKKYLSDFRIVVGGSILLLIVLASIFAPLLSSYAPEMSDLALRLKAPGDGFFLGTDKSGADVWTSLLHGGRISLGIAALTVLLSLCIGTTLGVMSGYFGGYFDHGLMRLVDVLMAFPGILLALTISAILGPSFITVIFAIAATGWVGTTRLVRGEVLSLKERDFVQAAKSLGIPTYRILFRHLVPQLLPVLLIHVTFSLSGVILVESSLSFLGLGPGQGSPTWGKLLSDGKDVIMEAPHLTIVPGLAIFLVVFSFNFIGDALRDIWNPKD